MTYTVTLQPDAQQFTVNDDESLLDAATRHGIQLEYGCRDGRCGSCQCTVLEGEIEYPDGRPARIDDEQEANGAVLICKAHAKSDLVVKARVLEGFANLPIKKLPCRIAHIKQVCHDVMQLQLKIPESQRMQYLAGQYIEFLLSNGHHRAFSIANAPHNDEYIELHIRHVPDGEFSEYIFNEAKEKAMLRIMGPLGTFVLREDSPRPIILMAGGTGFAPIKGIVEHALYNGIDRPIHIYRGVRAKRDLYMHELPEKWAAENDHITYTPVLSDPIPEDNWNGKTGYVHNIIVEDFPDMSDLDVYAGGPPQMVYAGLDLFSEHGLPREQYFSDAFEYAKDEDDS